MATLQKIRDKSWLLVTVIGVALLAFVFMDGASSLSGGGCNSTQIENVGTVLGEDISKEDFDIKLEQREMVEFLFQRQNDGFLRNNQVWDDYIKNIIMENEFEKIGLDISDEEWVLRIKDQNNVHPILKEFYTRFIDTSGVYNGELAWSQIQQISQLPDGDQYKILWNNYEKIILFDYKYQKYQTLIGQSMYATSYEAKDNILAFQQNAIFDYVAIPYRTIKNEDVTVTDNDIKSYYSKNKGYYKKEASNDVDLIFFTPEPSIEDDERANSIALSAIKKLENTKEYSKFRTDSDYANFYNYVYNTADISNVKWEEIINKEASRTLQILIDFHGSTQALEKIARASLSDIRVQILNDFNRRFENIKSQKNEARKGLTSNQWLDLFNSEEGKVIGPYLVKEGVYRVAKNASVDFRPDSVELRHIMISLPLPGDAVEEYPLLVKNAEKDIDSIRLLIESGADFTIIANSMSDDILTKNRGGNLGWISESTTMFTGAVEEYAQEFNNSCFTNEIGSLLKLKSEYGYHLVQITKKSPLVRKVKIVYADSEVQISGETTDNYLLQAAKFKQDLSKNKSNLDELVVKYNGLIRSVKGVKYTDQNILNIDKSRQIIKWLYKNEEGSISDVTELLNNNRDIVVAYAAQKYTDGFIPLEDVKEQIKSMVINEKKAFKIKESIGIDLNLNEIANMYSTNVVSGKSVKFDTLTSITGLGNEQSLAGNVFGSKLNIISKPIIGKNAVYIISVTSFDSPSLNDEEIINRKANLRRGSSFSSIFSYDALKKDTEIIDQRILFY